MTRQLPLELVVQAALAIGELRSSAVFLGGSIVGLLIEEPGGLPPRFTQDVDLAIEIGGGYSDLVGLDRSLIALGFSNDIAGPFCRYLMGSMRIDVIPVAPGSGSGVNAWYSLALRTARPMTLHGGLRINVIEPVCFIGAKLAAFRSPQREHHDDIFLSRDFEDIIRVIDGRPRIADEVLKADPGLQKHVRNEFSQLLDARFIEEAIAEHVDPGREAAVIQRIRSFL